MKSKLLFLFILTGILFRAELYAGETGRISGKVKDKTTGEKLFGANIVLLERINDDGATEKIRKPLGAATDIDGDYYILAVTPGIYNIKFSCIGYADEILNKVKVNIDKTTIVDIELSSRAHVTSEVIVTAYNEKKVEADLTATKQTYEIAQVKEIAGVADVSDILSLQPDVLDDHFRGGRAGQSNYLIAGSSIVNPLTNSRAFNPIVGGLRTVEVLTSGFSAEYGNAQSGVVNMIPREGGEKWQTTLDLSGIAPGYKVWGGNPYDPSNLQFYSSLKNTTDWLGWYNLNSRPLWDLGNSFSGYAGGTSGFRDTLRVARIAQVLFEQQMRDIGMKYNNTVDSRFDFSLGGPLSDNSRLFVAGRQQQVFETVPTNDPDYSRQVMSNLTWQPYEKHKFGFRFVWDNEFNNVLSASSYQKYLFNRTLDVAKTNSHTYQLGLDYKGIFSSNLVFDLKLNYLSVLNNQRIELLQDAEFADAYTKNTNWSSTLTNPANFNINAMPSSRLSDKAKTFDVNVSVNYQINKDNLIKAGIQAATANFNVGRANSISSASSVNILNFKKYPYEGGVYIQDKMEFEGMIANVGLRFDFYNFNTKYYSNLFDPLANPYYDESLPLGQRGKSSDASLAALSTTKIYTRLQPRIGFSFPISEYTVFHINYGTFTQRPSYEQIYYNQVTKYGDIVSLGNPRLKPENTKMYDIGLVATFEGFKLDVSAYYKDIKDLVENAIYKSKSGTEYQTFENRDYSDVKGFFITLEGANENVQVFARYNYESATGKSSAPNAASSAIYTEDGVSQPPAADIYMDYDRSHKVVSNFLYRILDNEGPEVLGINPLENTTFSLTFRFFTGRPYTPTISLLGLRNSERTPNEYDLRARIQRKIKIFNNNFSLYFEVINLLNSKILNYSSVFAASTTTSSTINPNKQQYENDPGSIAINKQFDPYYTSQALWVYSNQPMTFRFGFSVNL